MDKAPFHKRNDIQQAIIDTGHLIKYLPDLNPIEHRQKAKKERRGVM